MKTCQYQYMNHQIWSMNRHRTMLLMRLFNPKRTRSSSHKNNNATCFFLQVVVELIECMQSFFILGLGQHQLQPLFVFLWTLVDGCTLQHQLLRLALSPFWISNLLAITCKTFKSLIFTRTFFFVNTYLPSTLRFLSPMISLVCTNTRFLSFELNICLQNFIELIFKIGQ